MVRGKRANGTDLTHDQFQHLVESIDRLGSHLHARIDGARTELRQDVKDARTEAAEDHALVRQRLDNVEHNQAAMLAQHERDAARTEVVAAALEDRRRHRAWTLALAASVAAVISTAAGIIWSIVDHV